VTAAASDAPSPHDVSLIAKNSCRRVQAANARSRTLFEAGETPADASIRQTTALLERIDRDLAARFPLAMEFVRPGFDEPDVAAGALTRLAPFEPRQRRAWQRLSAWLSRMLRRRLGSVR
jgi:hypothetical protein